MLRVKPKGIQAFRLASEENRRAEDVKIRKNEKGQKKVWHDGFRENEGKRVKVDAKDGSKKRRRALGGVASE